jgi:hypothetical protein
VRQRLKLVLTYVMRGIVEKQNSTATFDEEVLERNNLSPIPKWIPSEQPHLR